MSEKVVIEGEELTLHPSGALFWEKKSLLMLSDVHLGKISHFRKFGAAIPAQAVQENFILLRKLVEEFEPFQIVFLGDLFHSSLNNEWLLFEHWVAATPSELILIAGNHDIISPLRFEKIGIHFMEEWEVGPFYLTHHPSIRQGKLNICGHIHPAVVLRGSGRQSLRLPCFFLKPQQLILPALGCFTGSHSLEMGRNDRAYVLADGEVIAL